MQLYFKVKENIESDSGDLLLTAQWWQWRVPIGSLLVAVVGCCWQLGGSSVVLPLAAWWGGTT